MNRLKSIDLTKMKMDAINPTQLTSKLFNFSID